jgi:hypothetical protein
MKRRCKQRDTSNTEHSGTHTHLYTCRDSKDALALLEGGPQKGVRQESDSKMQTSLGIMNCCGPHCEVSRRRMVWLVVLIFLRWY